MKGGGLLKATERLREYKRQQGEDFNIDENHSFNAGLDFTSLREGIVKDVMKYMEANRGMRYSRKEVRQMLQKPETSYRQLVQVSMWLANVSSHYMRLVYYFSTMLTFDYILIPQGLREIDGKEQSFKQNYNRSLTYMDEFGVKQEGVLIATIMMVQDAYFGYERRTKDSTMIQTLPFSHCKITGVRDGLYTFSFNMTYFKNEKDDRFRNFPPEFKQLYKQYRATQEQWQKLDSDKAVCLKFRQDLYYPLPPLVSIFEEILDLEEMKDLTQDRTKLDNFKLLLQKIPLKKDPKSEKDFVISLPTVKQFHNNIKAVLPPQIGLISSPMDIQDYTFDRKNASTTSNQALQQQEQLFNSAGVSSGLFNSGAKSAIGLNRSIQVDENMMFAILRQLERFFYRRIDNITSKVFRFKILFPDLTYYNRKEMQDQYLKLAQAGMPKSFVACAMGMTLEEMMDLSYFENEHLNLVDNLKPLQSSHTASGDDEGGRPQSSESQLGDKGAEQRDEGSNENRAQ